MIRLVFVAAFLAASMYGATTGIAGLDAAGLSLQHIFTGFGWTVTMIGLIGGLWSLAQNHGQWTGVASACTLIFFIGGACMYAPEIMRFAYPAAAAVI